MFYTSVISSTIPTHNPLPYRNTHCTTSPQHSLKDHFRANILGKIYKIFKTFNARSLLGADAVNDTRTTSSWGRPHHSESIRNCPLVVARKVLEKVSLQLPSVTGRGRGKVEKQTSLQSQWMGTCH